MPNLRLTKTAIDALKPGEQEAVYWDTELKGFGVRVHPTGRKTYITQTTCRATRKKWKATIGASNAISLSEARDRARKSLLETREGLTRKQPGAQAVSINDLWALFISETSQRRKTRTNKEYASSFRHWISPSIGQLNVADLSRTEIDRFLREVKVHRTHATAGAKLKGGIYPALHARSALSAMLTFAVERDIIPQNPCSQVRWLRQPKGRIRSLSDSEMARLGAVIRLRKSRGHSPQPLTIIELLLLTGARKNEICSLQWSFVFLDDAVARLPDSKTGPRILHLPPEAVAILRNHTRISGVPWVFPAATGGSYYQGLQKVWDSIRQEAGINDVRLHDLRHTYATWSIENGIPIYILRDVLNHSNVATTEKYIHESKLQAISASTAMGSRLSGALHSANGPSQGSDAVGY